MPQIRAGENIFDYAIRTAYEYGYLWHVPQKDIHKLKPDDPEVVQAMIAMSKMDALRYTKHTLNEHGRQPDFDGEIGPAMQAMVLEGGRCPVPDIAPPPGVVFQFEDPDLQQVVLKMQRDAQKAIGSGNWPGCHSVGNFHCAAIGVNDSGIQSFLAPLFMQVLTNVRSAYAGVGLLLKFIKNGKDLFTGESFSGQINSDMSFVQTSSGYIGIAIVGNNESCSSRIWNRYLASYRGGNTDADIVRQWTTLLKHELGHNCGRGHTAGGVMNSSIVNGLPTEWSESDPSTQWLRGQFGGIPVPLPGEPVPPIPPNPPSTVDQRLHALEVNDVVQKVTIDWIVKKVKNLP